MASARRASAKAAADIIRYRHNGPAGLRARLRAGRARWLALALLIAFSAGSAAADFDAGVAAFRAGDYAAARGNWAPLAKAGQPQAQFNLALLYSNGLGVAHSAKTARRWLQAAANQGNAQAQYNLALMLQLGDGVEGDIAAARRWYEQAARQGLASAQNNLGLMYLEGQGMPPDQARAIRWLKRAATENAEARNNLDGLATRLPTASVTASQVNLRAGPSRQARILDQVRPNDSGRLLDQRRGWSRLWFVERDAIGWVADRLLDIETSATAVAAPVVVDNTPEPRVADSAPANSGATDSGQAESGPPDQSGAQSGPDADEAPEPGRWYRVASASAELRAEPNSDARVLQRLRYDAAVEVLERKPGWRRVQLNSADTQGWVGAFVLTPDAEAEARTAAAAAVGSGGG